MKDRNGREIDYLRISITDRCNLRCRYCMPEKGVPFVPHAEILRYDEILRIVEICAELGISKLKITGGEPLLRKNADELIASAKQIPGIQKITLTTNGVLLGEHLPRLVKAGLDGVNISLDTLDRQRYERLTGQDRLPAVLHAIDAAAAYETLKVKVNVVDLKGWNEGELTALASLAADRAVDVRFIEMMPLGLGAGYRSLGRENVMEKLTECFGAAKAVTKRLGNGPAEYVHFEHFCGNIGFISAMSHKFCAGCNRVRLTAGGVLKPCLQYADGLDLKTLLRSGTDRQTLRSATAACIAEKPKEHCFAQQNAYREKKLMSSIGG